jgi:hypothetical protein
MSQAERFKDACRDVRELIAANPRCSKRFIRANTAGIGVVLVDGALERLLDEQRIKDDGSKARSAYVVADANPGEERDA